MTGEQEERLYNKLGCIEKGIENLDEKVETQNGNYATLAQKVQRHEVFLGKLGAGVAVFAFVIGTGASAATAFWIRFWSN